MSREGGLGYEELDDDLEEMDGRFEEAKVEDLEGLEVADARVLSL